MLRSAGETSHHQASSTSTILDIIVAKTRFINIYSNRGRGGGLFFILLRYYLVHAKVERQENNVRGTGIWRTEV